MSGTSTKTLHCAIYTRKSSEEGLEQDFNSLHAQREACEAYIKSQRHEGWVLVPKLYDDGGYSGGTLERPAIQRLLAEVAARRIQIVIVYTVDRLTRSLADFARIVETFDQHGASFVSVTQQFNTTSSMGRLTLNVLLSFAQFEREVTGERIRDKIAASKRKGLWMGGRVPLGYAPKDRTLVVVPEDAETVRRLFKRYLELRSVNDLANEMNAKGITTKRRTSKHGVESGGVTYWKGPLYHLLRNPIYLGEIRHKDKTFPGQHEAIVSRDIWDRAQQCLGAGARRLRGAAPIGSGSPLCGKLFDTAGNRMTPTHTRKPGGQRYRYYVSLPRRSGGSADNIEIPRISAGVIEPLVLEALRRHPDAPPLGSVRRIEVGSTKVRIEIGPGEASDASRTDPAVITLPVLMCRRGNERIIRAAGDAESARPVEPDRALVQAMIRSYQWRAKLDSGEFKSIEALARTEKASPTDMAKLLQLAFLAPDLTEAILDGNQPSQLTLANVRARVIPLDWVAQRELFART